MITPELVRERLTATVVADGMLRDVGLAGDLATAFEQMNISQRGFVVPANENAQPNSTGSFYVSQRVASSFTVFFGVALINDPMGAKALNKLLPIREAIKTALVGCWAEGEDDPVQYRDGVVADIDPKAGFIIYAVTFFNSYELRS